VSWNQREKRELPCAPCGEAVFAGTALREADRHEAGHRDEGAGQHRKRRRGVGVGGGPDLVVALFELGDHHLDRDHGVVDQQAEGDDQRAERDALQRDAGELHDDERHRQHQRDGDCHHHAGPPAERQETHQKHDRDGFHQRLGELADRFLDDMRLVGDQAHVDTDRQLRVDALGASLDVLAEGQRVTARRHGNSQSDGRFALIAEQGLRRIDIAAADLDDIAQAEKAAVGREVDGLQAFLRREAARYADGDALGASFDHAARSHGVLCLQRLRQRVDVEAERGNLLGRELKIDLLVLHTDQVDLGDIGHAQQFGADALGVVAHLAAREAVGCQRVDDGIGVAELVIEIGAIDTRRQVLADVADFLAHLVPEVRHLGGAHAVLQVDEHDRLARLGIAAHEVEVRHLLKLLFNAIGDLVDGLGGGRAGPQRLDHHN